jgi:nitrogen fixation protein FixH
MPEPPNPRRFNPVAWLVVGIPVATVIAGVWTLRLAAGDSATDAHPDQVRRMAQVQQASTDADQAAARDGLSARIEVAADHVLVSVHPTAGTRAPVLMLRHPIESRLDRALELSPHPRGWRSRESLAAPHGWQLQLVADDGRWRLVGRYRPGDTELLLQPALRSP